MTVAMLGTGVMGTAMARNLARDTEVTVWNRSPSRAEPLADVATVATSVPDAVQDADVVITMLYDADSVVEVMSQARGHLRDETVWVQQSTIGVAGCDRTIELARDLGVTLVDAPVLGTRKPAEDGALVVLASGPSSSQVVVQPLFDAMGRRTLWVGEAGAGTRLKLCTNAWIGTMLEGMADSLALARALGLDPQLFLDAVKGGAMDAPYLQTKAADMLAGTMDDPAFTLAATLKDIDLILDAAADAGLELGPMPGVRAHVARAVEAGHGEKDMAATWLAH